jgi:hypothetical protein
VQQAFVYALNSGLRIGAAVCVVGAVLAWLLIGDRAVAPADAPAARQAEAEPELVEVA